MNTNVPVGPTSIAGWLVAAAGFLGAFATAFTGSQAELSGPGKWQAICGLAALAITNIGRYAQAVKAPEVALPTAAEEAAAPPPVMVRPETAAVPDGAVPAPPAVA